MKYFDLLDNIQLDNAEIKNLFQQIVLKGEVPVAFQEQIMMQDGDSLESLAFRYYGNHELFWVLAVLNDIEDLIYDLPLPLNVLQTISKNETVIVLEEMAERQFIKQWLVQRFNGMRETQSFFDIIDPLTNEQINAQAQAELESPGTFYNQIFLIMMQNLEFENDRKRDLTIIKPPFIKKVVGQVFEAVKRARRQSNT